MRSTTTSEGTWLRRGWAERVGDGQFRVSMYEDAARATHALVTLAEVQRGEWVEAATETALILRHGEEGLF